MVEYRTSITYPDKSAQRLAEDRKRCAGVMAAFEAARYRTTSRSEHVYIWLASLLGWDGADINSVPAEQRVRLTLEQQTSLPQGIIFVPGPRTDDRGWRWAVTNFDNEEQGLMEARTEDYEPAPCDANGITVKYPGIVVHNIAAMGSDGPKDVLVSTTGASYEAPRVWWRITSLDPLDLAAYAGSLLAAIFYPPTPDQSVPRDVQMAAALVSIQACESHAIYDIDRQLNCQYRGLAMVQLVGSDEAADCLVRRKDVRVKKEQQMAGYIKRAWTVQ